MARIHPRKARVVELRFVGRLNVGEAAEVLEISVETSRGAGKWPEPGFFAGLSERDTRS